MECGHEVKYIVYSERRNYCAICGENARRRNIPFANK
jgi:ribosomal protein L37E